MNWKLLVIWQRLYLYWNSKSRAFTISFPFLALSSLEILTDACRQLTLIIVDESPICRGPKISRFGLKTLNPRSTWFATEVFRGFPAKEMCPSYFLSQTKRVTLKVTTTWLMRDVPRCRWETSRWSTSNSFHDISKGKFWVIPDTLQYHANYNVCMLLECRAVYVAIGGTNSHFEYFCKGH